VKRLALAGFLLILFLFILARAVDQNTAEHNSGVPAAVTSVAPDDEGTTALSPLDLTTDTLPFSAEG